MTPANTGDVSVLITVHSGGRSYGGHPLRYILSPWSLCHTLGRCLADYINGNQRSLNGQLHSSFSQAADSRIFTVTISHGNTPSNEK